MLFTASQIIKEITHSAYEKNVRSESTRQVISPPIVYSVHIHVNSGGKGTENQYYERMNTVTSLKYHWNTRKTTSIKIILYTLLRVLVTF